MLILNDQRRSLFFVILSSSIPFCILDRFLTHNKDPARHNIIKHLSLVVDVHFLPYFEFLYRRVR